jgi:hypothetical protein
MRSIYNYIKENVISDKITPEQSKENKGDDTSDDSLLFRVGYYNLVWKMKDPQERIIDKYNIHGSNKRKGIIQYAKEHTFPLLSDDMEVIHRKDWELDILNGVSLDALYHPHYDKWFDNMYKKHKPKHKVMVAFECSNKKPYCWNHINMTWVQRFGDFCDFGTFDAGIVPWQFSNLYPYRWDEWDHYAEDKYMTYCYVEDTKKGLLKFHKQFPEYEKIIFICQNERPQRPVQELWDDNVENIRDWVVILVDDKLREDVKKQFKRGTNPGIIIQRITNSHLTKKKFADELMKIYKDKKTKDLILKRLNAETYDLNKEGVVNIYDPEIAKLAYKHKVDMYDPEYSKYIEEYKKMQIKK